MRRSSWFSIVALVLVVSFVGFGARLWLHRDAHEPIEVTPSEKRIYSTERHIVEAQVPLAQFREELFARLDRLDERLAALERNVAQNRGESRMTVPAPQPSSLETAAELAERDEHQLMVMRTAFDEEAARRRAIEIDRWKRLLRAVLPIPKERARAFEEVVEREWFALGALERELLADKPVAQMSAVAIEDCEKQREHLATELARALDSESLAAKSLAQLLYANLPDPMAVLDPRLEQRVALYFDER